MNRFPASLVICACLLAGFSAFGQMKPTNSGTAARMPALITPMQHPAPEPEAPVLQPGALAPDFVSRDASGKAVRISDFKGKVVILDFWATWCGPCQASMPHTQTLAKNFKDQGVVVLAVWHLLDPRHPTARPMKPDGRRLFAFCRLEPLFVRFPAVAQIVDDLVRTQTIHIPRDDFH